MSEDEAVGGGRWAVGSRQLAVGSWQSAVGSWQLAVGSWQLAVGSRRSAMKFGFGVWGMAAATCDTFFGAWFAGKLQDLRFVNVDLGCAGVTYLL